MAIARARPFIDFLQDNRCQDGGQDRARKMDRGDVGERHVFRRKVHKQVPAAEGQRAAERHDPWSVGALSNTVGLLMISGAINRQLNRARKKTISKMPISLAIIRTMPSCTTMSVPEIRTQKVHWMTAGQLSMASWSACFIAASVLFLLLPFARQGGFTMRDIG